jgi:hypothetical protein
MRDDDAQGISFQFHVDRRDVSNRHEPEFGPLPDWLRLAVDPVLADLQRPRPLPLEVGYDLRAGDAWPTLWVREEGERFSCVGCGLYDGVRGAELIVQIAEHLQEQFFPESRGAWGEARPECPTHTHPATPELSDGEAWWVCPFDGHRLGLIGQLGVASAG